MKLRIVKPGQGLVWVRQGLQIARQQPLNLLGLMGLVATAALLLMSLPVLGPLVVVAAMPLVWMGFMLATRHALAGEKIQPVVLIEPVRGMGFSILLHLTLAGCLMFAFLRSRGIADDAAFLGAAATIRSVNSPIASAGVSDPDTAPWDNASAAPKTAVRDGVDMPSASVNDCPIRLLPNAFPSVRRIDPSALSFSPGIWASSQIASG